jgi:hypothetical protein
LKQADISRESNLSRAHVSRLFNGDQHSLSDENFIAVLNAFSRHKQSQAELIAARCMDARIGPGADLVEITIKTATENRAKENDEFLHVELSKDAERAFAWLISQCPLNSEMEQHLIGFARLTGMK